MLAGFIRLFGGNESKLRRAPQPFRYAVIENLSGHRIFVKSYPNNTKAEFLRGEALYDAARSTKLFIAPRPLSLIEDQKIILWEYLEGLIEVREYLTGHLRADPADVGNRRLFFNKIGQVLAAVHEGLTGAISCEKWSPIIPRSGEGVLDRYVEQQLLASPHRPLHWDYACGNLFVKGGGSAGAEIVVLDAMANHYVLQQRGPGVESPVYVDIGQFIFSIYGHPVFSEAISSEADIYVSAFLEGYRAGSGIELDRAVAFACAGEIARLYQVYRRKKSSNLASRSERRDLEFRSRAERRLFNVAMENLPG